MGRADPLCLQRLVSRTLLSWFSSFLTVMPAQPPGICLLFQPQPREDSPRPCPHSLLDTLLQSEGGGGVLVHTAASHTSGPRPGPSLGLWTLSLHLPRHFPERAEFLKPNLLQSSASRPRTPLVAQTQSPGLVLHPIHLPVGMMLIPMGILIPGYPPATRSCAISC